MDDGAIKPAINTSLEPISSVPEEEFDDAHSPTISYGTSTPATLAGPFTPRVDFGEFGGSAASSPIASSGASYVLPGMSQVEGSRYEQRDGEGAVNGLMLLSAKRVDSGREQVDVRLAGGQNDLD